MKLRAGYRREIAQDQVRASGLSFFPSFGYALLSVLLTVLLRYLLILLARERSNVPTLLYDSDLGMLALYSAVNLFVLLLVFLINLSPYGFPELANNQWHLLTSMGVPVTGLFFTKVLTLCLLVLRAYTMGFLLTLVSGRFFDLPFYINFLLALYCAGAALLLLSVMLTLTIGILLPPLFARAVLTLLALSLPALPLVFWPSTLSLEPDQVMFWLFSPPVGAFWMVTLLSFLLYLTVFLIARQRALRPYLRGIKAQDLQTLFPPRATELFYEKGSETVVIADSKLFPDQS